MVGMKTCAGRRDFRGVKPVLGGEFWRGEDSCWEGELQSIGEICTEKKSQCMLFGGKIWAYMNFVLGGESADWCWSDLGARGMLESIAFRDFRGFFVHQ